MTDRRWYTRAACRETDPELWFPAHGQNSLMARRICGTCDVAAECLADALAYETDHPLNHRFGIYAGLDPRAREALSDGESRRKARPLPFQRKATS